MNFTFATHTRQYGVLLKRGKGYAFNTVSHTAVPRSARITTVHNVTV